MVRAVMMTKGQIGELVTLARNDLALWDELKDRELEIEKRLQDVAKQGKDVDDHDAVFDEPKMPTMAMMISKLVKDRYGAEEIFDHGSLIMALRYQIRKELDLPV